MRDPNPRRLQGIAPCDYESSRYLAEADAGEDPLDRPGGEHRGAPLIGVGLQLELAEILTDRVAESGARERGGAGARELEEVLGLAERVDEVGRSIEAFEDAGGALVREPKTLGDPVVGRRDRGEAALCEASPQGRGAFRL